MLYVSVAAEDLTVNNLICLARDIKQGVPKDRSEVFVDVFDSFTAAENFEPSDLVPVSDANRNSRQHFRAVYHADTSKGEEKLQLCPLGCLDSRYVTTIDLLTKTPHCEDALQNRCILAFAMTSDLESAGGELSGFVTLTGTINKNGTLSRVNVRESAIVPSGKRQTAIRVTRKNVATWRVEPRDRSDVFQITYKFGYGALGDVGVDEWKIEVPNRVAITAPR